MATSKKRKGYTKPKGAFSERDVELTQMVKRANERLRQLERKGLKTSPAYKAAERLALEGGKLMSKVSKKNSPNLGKLKFSTDIRGMSINERSKLREEVKRFLNADTSTVKGVKKVVEKVIPAYKERFKNFDFSGIDMEEILNIWTTSIARQYLEMYGSDKTSDAINTVITNFDNPEDMNSFLEDQYGKPWADVQSAIENLDFQPADNENLPWEWDDIFKKGNKKP